MGSQDLSVLDGLDTNAAELRAALAAFQPGVFLPGDFKVAPRGVGANRSIDLPGGRAVIGSPVGTMPTFMGPNYLVGETALINSDAFELGGFTPPHASFARMDQIILRLYDNEGGLKKWRPEVLTGQVPTVNATLDLRQSASNLPAGVPVLRVADVVVPTTGIITATEIRDRRPWARGYMEWDLVAATLLEATGLDSAIDKEYRVSLEGRFDGGGDNFVAYVRPNGLSPAAVTHLVGALDSLGARNAYNDRYAGNVGALIARTYGAVAQHAITADLTMTAQRVGGIQRVYRGQFASRRTDAINADFVDASTFGYMEVNAEIFLLRVEMSAPMTFTGRLRIDRR